MKPHLLLLPTGPNVPKGPRGRGKGPPAAPRPPIGLGRREKKDQNQEKREKIEHKKIESGTAGGPIGPLVKSNHSASSRSGPGEDGSNQDGSILGEYCVSY